MILTSFEVHHLSTELECKTVEFICSLVRDKLRLNWIVLVLKEKYNWIWFESPVAEVESQRIYSLKHEKNLWTYYRQPSIIIYHDENSIATKLLRLKYCELWKLSALWEGEDNAIYVKDWFPFTSMTGFRLHPHLFVLLRKIWQNLTGDQFMYWLRLNNWWNVY